MFNVREGSEDFDTGLRLSMGFGLQVTQHLIIL